MGMKARQELRVVIRYLARWIAVSLINIGTRGGAALGDKFSLETFMSNTQQKWIWNSKKRSGLKVLNRLSISSMRKESCVFCSLLYPQRTQYQAHSRHSINLLNEWDTFWNSQQVVTELMGMDNISWAACAV